jgi:HNH endonuclease
MKLTFCAACGSRDDLQHHHLVTRGEAGSNDERNLITLCGSCHARLHERLAISARGAAAAAERARDFAERLRPVLAQLAGLSANAAARELMRKGVATAHGGLWSAGAVIAIRKRLETESARRAMRGQETG